MLLILAGFLIGGLGALVGVGGGVLMVPLLLHLYPDAPGIWVAGVSMTMVALTASSGSISYYLKKVIHLKMALICIVASIPGSFLGVSLNRLVERSTFEKIFGVVLLGLAALVVLRKKPVGLNSWTAGDKLPREFFIKGGGLSLGVGFISSFLGIGGGVIHVPLLIQWIGFPVLLAAGTSQLILAATAWMTLSLHWLQGNVDWHEPVIWQVGISAAIGAQVGARLAHRVPGAVILRLLAALMVLVGINLLKR